jgi:protein TonB
MKRFLSLSIVLHAVALLLLFSWEIPVADRLPARSVVEVSLVEQIEGRPRGKKEEGDKKSEKKGAKKDGIQAKKMPGETRGSTVFDPGAQTRKEPSTRAIPLSSTPRLRPGGSLSRASRSNDSPESLAERLAEVRVPGPKEEVKKEEPKPEKIEPVQKEVREEKANEEEEKPAEPPVLTAGGEKIWALLSRMTPPAGGAAEMKEPAGSLKASPTPGGRGEGGPVFFASPGPESAKEGIAVGGGGKGSGAGKGEGGTSRFTGVQGSSGDGDSVIAEILRRIEGAKRYPRMARKMGIEGRATVRFKLRGNGKIERAELVETSGSEILDQASLETVRRAAPLPYKEGWLKVVIVFKIL